jgi:xylulose-5-phosphate/fructose-6-phosphate phosphoketolase
MSETATLTDDQKRTGRDETSLAPLPALSKEGLSKIDAYWRACNYLAAGMIYLRANPLLREPLKVDHSHDLRQSRRLEIA